MKKWKRRLALAVALAALSSSAIANADTDKKACLDAVDEGQKLRDEGKLKRAREKFLVCASKGCPSAVLKQCDEWVTEVEHDTPTVVFRVRDRQGREVIDATVFLDGENVADAIPATALTLDPTVHTVRFVLPDGTILEEKFLLRAGEKNRMVERRDEAPAAPERAQPTATPVATPEPRPAPGPAEQGFRIPVLGWAFGGVFVAGAATTVIFAVMAKSAESDLRSTCAPRCAADDRDAIQTKLVIANIGAGVGLAGLGLAVVTTLLANRHPAKMEARSGLRVVAMPGGIGGTF